MFLAISQIMKQIYCQINVSLDYCCNRRHHNKHLFSVIVLGGVATTPDPNTSAKVSRYKWDPYRDTNWWCIYYFLPSRGNTFAKVLQ